MEAEIEKLRRANAELQAWVRDLLEENRCLRARVVDAPRPERAIQSAPASAAA